MLESVHPQPSLSMCGNVIRKGLLPAGSLIRLGLRRLAVLTLKTHTEQHTPPRLQSWINGNPFSLGVLNIMYSFMTKYWKIHAQMHTQRAIATAGICVSPG